MATVERRSGTSFRAQKILLAFLPQINKNKDNGSHKRSAMDTPGRDGAAFSARAVEAVNS
jgi:hypothetical protein